MALAGTIVANFYTGFNSTAWTAWLFFAVSIGLIVEWLYTVSITRFSCLFFRLTIVQVIYSALSPSFTSTQVYGNNDFLFPSAYFWLSLPLTLFLSLAPRYLIKAWQFTYYPGDLETFQYLQAKYPNQDLSRFSGSEPEPALAALRRRSTLASRRSSRASSMVVSLERQSTRASVVDVRMRSRTDMSTGLVSVDRGFDFVTEEHGVEMRRVQTNLSEKRSNKHASGSQSREKDKKKLSNVLSLSRNFLRRKHAYKGSE
jgi:phospholipid-translocating ATPase